MRFAILFLFIAALCVDLSLGRRHHRHHSQPEVADDEDVAKPDTLHVPKKVVHIAVDHQLYQLRVKQSGKTAALAASTAAEKLKAIPHIVRGVKHNVLTTIKMGVLVAVDGLRALKAAQRAQRLGHNQLARLVRRQGASAITAGRVLLQAIKTLLIKCTYANAAILQQFYGVDVASLFGHHRDQHLVLQVAELANKAAIAAHRSSNKAKLANKHAKNVARVALQIAKDELS